MRAGVAGLLLWQPRVRAGRPSCSGVGWHGCQASSGWRCRRSGTATRTRPGPRATSAAGGRGTRARSTGPTGPGAAAAGKSLRAAARAGPGRGAGAPCALRVRVYIRPWTTRRLQLHGRAWSSQRRIRSRPAAAGRPAGRGGRRGVAGAIGCASAGELHGSGRMTRDELWPRSTTSKSRS